MKTKDILKELQSKTPKDLLTLIKEKRKELIKATYQFALGKTSELAKVRALRKDIARTQTVLTQKITELAKKTP
ncbi:50S ribosomal protein L29 [Candidatus Berkelbacteria bacterium]|nr:50S ribosomal protein L29 [Candidatus Berkelbacteria bacterium]